MSIFITSAKVASVLSITLALAACDQQSPYFETVNQNSTVAQTASNRCDANALQNFIGQPKSAVERANLGRPIRFIAAGQFVTDTDDATRANFLLNEDEIVTDVRCG